MYTKGGESLRWGLIFVVVTSAIPLQAIIYHWWCLYDRNLNGAVMMLRYSIYQYYNNLLTMTSNNLMTPCKHRVVVTQSNWRYFMDVPHHWEGWVVGEELGSLSNDGDADCPVDISIYCLSSILCFFWQHNTPQASLGSGWDVANDDGWQEDSSLTITCSFWLKERKNFFCENTHSCNFKNTLDAFQTCE